MKNTLKSKFKFTTRTLYAYNDPNKRVGGNEFTTPITTTVTAFTNKV